MSTHPLVVQLYARVWNAGDENVGTLLANDFAFYGSLGTPTRGHTEFRKIVHSVRASLANHNCEILECVIEHSKAFARMRFSGSDVEVFRGSSPTGKQVQA